MGSTRSRRQRGVRGARGAHGEEGLVVNRTDVIGHSSGRRTPLVYGGVYIWYDAAAMQAYLSSDLAKGVVVNPNFANLTSRVFEVLSRPTTSSGRPFAASLKATGSLS